MIISEELQSWLITYLWMKDEQANNFKSMNPSIKFADMSPEMADELKQWFDDITAQINAPGTPSNYKVDLGQRLGCFPIAMDHVAMQILTDNNTRRNNQEEHWLAEYMG